MKTIFFFLFIIPNLIISQGVENSDPKDVLVHNQGIVEQLAQVTSMGVNPYSSVFLTSVASKIGYSNEYVKTHPFYNNWFVVSIFGILFLFTLIIRPSLKLSKSLSILSSVDEQLEDNAILVINGIIIVVPVIISDSPASQTVLVEAGILSINLKTIFVLVLSTYYLIVVTVLRQFITFLIFLSPIPLLDSLFEGAKIVVTFIFVFISIYSPTTSFIIAIVLFIIGLLFYKRAKRLFSKFSYVFRFPIYNLFKNKRKILYDKNGGFSILTLTKMKTKKFNRGKILRLTIENDQVILTNERLFFPNKKEIINDKTCQITANNLNILIEFQDDIKLVLNRSYHKYLDEINEIIKPEKVIDKRTKFTKAKGFFSKVKNMFNKQEIKNFKQRFNHI